MESILAIVHFVLIIAVGALLLAELVVLKLEASEPWLKLISRLDLYYGLAAILVIASGLSRVFLGDVPATFWASSHLFWTKMALFGVIAALSAIPTMVYLKWQRSFRTEGRLPDTRERRKIARWVHAQLGLFAFLPILAVLMAQAAEKT